MAYAALNDTKLMDNLNALDGFMAGNANVGGNLRAHKVGFDMRSTHTYIGGFGGAAVIDDKVHLDDTIMKLPTKGFMRTAVHEMGHATFQRLLICNEHWKEEANLGQQAPDEKALDASGRMFYEAWSVLRVNPQYFFVKTLAKDKPEGFGKGRQGYLAKQFTEFCAESFMHLALEKGGLLKHIESLETDESVPGEVKAAWQKALTVLLQYESRILGSKPWEGGL